MRAPLPFSLLVPTLNRPDHLGRLLASIQIQTRTPDEIVVIDQSDDSRSRELFESWQAAPQTKKVYLHRTVKSLILARNAGLDASGKVDLVAFLDDDLVLRPSFCEHIVTRFEMDTMGLYAGGMGTIAGSRKRFKPLQTLFMMPREGSGKFSRSGAPTFPHWKGSFSDTEFLSGGITFWRKEILMRHRFDERMVGYGYGDDVDVSYRISRKHRNFIEPLATCEHEDHAPGREQGFAYRRGWIQNFYYLAQKNGISRFWFLWCALGHVLRDLICMDGPKLRGDLVALRNIARGEIDTVVGYAEFVRERGIR